MGDAALVLAPFSGDALDTLRRRMSVDYESWTETRRLYAPDELCDRLNSGGITILIVEADFVLEEVFHLCPSLRFLGVCRNSIEHIDIEVATEYGVMVVNCPGRNTQAVAELTISLMLTLARGAAHLNGYVRAGKWEDPAGPYISERGVELQGKTLGILGLGSIGRTVARLGRAFGMRVVAYDPYAGAPGKRKSGAQLAPLDEVLRQSDFLSVHTPNSPDTAGLLDADRLNQLKDGAYIINTATYPVIDEHALVEGLRSGRVAGAAFDVHRTHPIHPSSPLLQLENVILTPHIGGATDGTVERQSWMIVEDIGRYLDGLRPRRLVNREVWRRRG